jgi:hypothetical protein
MRPQTTYDYDGRTYHLGDPADVSLALDVLMLDGSAKWGAAVGLCLAAPRPKGLPKYLGGSASAYGRQVASYLLSVDGAQWPLAALASLGGACVARVESYFLDQTITAKEVEEAKAPFSDPPPADQG